MNARHLYPCLLMSALSAYAATVAAADAGRIKISAGAVHLERAGQRIPAPVDTVVQTADTIVTGADGSVGVTFADNTRVSAGPNSALAVNRYSFDQTTHAGSFDATLKRGTLAVISGKMTRHSPQAMTVRTPTLVMGVRGTEFIVHAGE